MFGTIGVSVDAGGQWNLLFCKKRLAKERIASLPIDNSSLGLQSPISASRLFKMRRG